MKVKLIDYSLIKQHGKVIVDLATHQANNLIALNKAKSLDSDLNININKNFNSLKGNNNWTPPEEKLFEEITEDVKDEDIVSFIYPKPEDALFANITQ